MPFAMIAYNYVSSDLMKKKLSIVILAVVVALAGWFFYREFKETDEADYEKFFNFNVYDESIDETTVEVRFRQPFDVSVAALREDPDDFNNWVQLGVIKKGLNDFEGAEEIWLYADTLRPGNSLTTANLADLYTNFLKNTVKAEKWYKETLNRDKTDTQTARNLAYFYFHTLNRTDDAIQVLEDAVGNNPQSVDTLIALASLYEESGDIESAISTWQKVLTLNDSPEFRAKIKELQAL
jgi:tetratricopeptide (TPR) repeat protein